MPVKTYAIACWVFASTGATLAQGTAFTYQGRLQSAGAPAHGLYDFRVGLYDSTNQPGNLVAGPITAAATPVSHGLFIVTLDFGPGVFNGRPLFLDIGVSPPVATGASPR